MDETGRGNTTGKSLYPKGSTEMVDKTKRTLIQYHTRELDRSVAHHVMKKLGLHQVNKGRKSFFSDKWRKYALVDLNNKKSRKELIEEG